jgi:hypothetical protein
MATLAEVRAAVRTTLETSIDGLTVYARVPEKPNLPCVLVTPAETDFNVAMGRGVDTWQFDLAVIVSAADVELAQDQLDEYIAGQGPRSIRQAVFVANTLGLPGTAANVSRMSNYGARYEFVGVDHVGATLRLTVHTRGT